MRLNSNQKDDPSEVAKQGFEALMAGKDAISAGSVMTKIQGNVSKVLPDTIAAEQHRQLTEPGSAESPLRKLEGICGIS
ncbi:hypothetical protein [Gloeocapsopsis sp. IPPAS B-1203]|uniref:hypothetical protein n=1 Tax=Gloeocapsopsis sp. IPPAS B-1203 TaxID=2049454 RepID=UPI0025A1D83B|nr:hypothetical protein [Gloeocapsopsis sp. IPPAS B-1203]